MKSPTKKLWIAATACAALLSALLFSFAGGARAQSSAPLPIAGQEAAKDVPGAKELPDPSITYKVVFDITKMAAKPEELNPGLVDVSRYFNTLAKYGVPADHRRIAVVLHGEAAEIIQNNAAFKARNSGHDNPNIALIQSMKQAGMDFRVCGQAVLARKIEPKNIMPEIELDLWALTTIINFESRGYVHIGE